jgi:hypothetical protein
MLRKAAVLALCGAWLALAFAPSADASATRHPPSRHPSAHKRHLRRVLLRELKRHPRIVMSRRFMHRAAAADLQLPMTVRLNPLITPGPTSAPSDDTLSLDLGTDPFADPAGTLASAVGTTLHGKFGIVGRFDVDTTGYGTLGLLKLDAGQVQMTDDAFPLVEPSVACGDGGPLLQTGPVSIVDAPPLPAGDRRGGLLNWFTGDFSMRLYTQFDLNSQRRASCADPFFWTDRIASTSNSVIPIDMVGHAAVSPTLTTDGRLRLFTLSFDDAVIPQAALPAILHTCTQATATPATDPAPSATCDGVSGDEAQVPMSVRLTKLTAEVLIGDAS